MLLKKNIQRPRVRSMLDKISSRSGEFLPLELFNVWLEKEKPDNPIDCNIFALATADAAGFPNVRLMLLKSVDHHGLWFFSNKNSEKGQEIGACPRGAFTMFLPSCRRQVRGRGLIDRLSAQESDDYFSSRPRGSQIGAWASAQSLPLEDRAILEGRVAEVEQQFAGKPVPRPPYWVGYRLLPLVMEFWSERPNRLHERVQFARESIDEPWQKLFLYP